MKKNTTRLDLRYCPGGDWKEEKAPGRKRRSTRVVSKERGIVTGTKGRKEVINKKIILWDCHCDVNDETCQ